ncbi:MULTISPECIES: hypothetical protein [Mesorhizobium]|uniref:hypothetical protein n=1 Tax=Mesorhizobium TaxID=68287 RepID=UPI000FCA21F5|nr:MULTISPECIES: hypothetical protein [Mesorhizobium]MCF6122505.1 hypothetical protein [Mesorhizobium ciceri]MCQ8815658.1 hypothetical protein [Mesorhizobium sp. SEMIA396]RUX79784.1 hypothetical protein EN983_10570 [Mesorhizobium sp. M7A.F.Ca.CA.004.08.2.1]RUY27612.1 hypothetical protein EN984_10665 [Mesorhizobium sp. M7A.F.Ca.CA.004.12.1.1]RUZ55437.1 hypothetical protein EN956_11625 [Mesorhizobium sp. M7A.F.Ca.CA.004.05.2.1]
MTGYKVISTDAVPGLKEVRLYESTIEHVKTEHPEVPVELPSIEIAVGSAISNPTHVEKSYGNSVVFVDTESTNATGDPLRLPVKLVGDGTSGRVKTFYFAETTGDRELVYRRPDEQD